MRHDVTYLVENKRLRRRLSTLPLRRVVSTPRPVYGGFVARSKMVEPLEAHEAHIEVARRLLAQERGSSGDSRERAAAAARVYETLFRVLAPVIGAAGVRALFARSARLASTEFPCLKEIPMIAEPPQDSAQVVEKLVGCLSKLEPAAGSEVATGLYAAFLGVMAKFIGEGLVLQIVTTAFPAIGEADTGPKEMA